MFVAYLLAVLAVGLLTSGGGDPQFHRWLHTALALLLLGWQLAVAAWAPRLSPPRRRLLRALGCCICVPIAFSMMACLLPAVHPEPYEWSFAALDVAVFGGYPTVWLQQFAWPPLVELLQWVYASFYLIPIAAALLALRCRGGAAFDRAITILVASFLFSYLGYLLVPTLSPKLCLDHGEPLRGVWLASAIHAAIDRSEANIWDCFPSGHTMLSLISLMLVRRWARPWFWPFALLVGLLVYSTMALRYHWVWDVAAGALLAWPSLRLCDLLLDRDGAAPA